MHTLHTRAASIYSSWAEEQRHLETGGRKIEADSRTLWAHCWCPLLQGKLQGSRPGRVRGGAGTWEVPGSGCLKDPEPVLTLRHRLPVL